MTDDEREPIAEGSYEWYRREVERLRGELAETREERDQLRQHILDIDAHATPYEDLPDDPGYVGLYLLTSGALHRALGKVGHTAVPCPAATKVAELLEKLDGAERRAEEAEDRLRAATDAYTRLRAEADAAEAARARWQERGKQAEAAVERVRALRPRSSQGYIRDYIPAAELRAALDAPSGADSTQSDSTDQQTTQHIGGQANAEDCPACSGTNPPYPFICRGEQ